MLGTVSAAMAPNHCRTNPNGLHSKTQCCDGPTQVLHACPSPPFSRPCGFTVWTTKLAAKNYGNMGHPCLDKAVPGKGERGTHGQEHFHPFSWRPLRQHSTNGCLRTRHDMPMLEETPSPASQLKGGVVGVGPVGHQPTHPPNRPPSESPTSKRGKTFLCGADPNTPKMTHPHEWGVCVMQSTQKVQKVHLRGRTVRCARAVRNVGCLPPPVATDPKVLNSAPYTRPAGTPGIFFLV